MNTILSYNKLTKTAYVQPAGQNPPTGATNVANITLPDEKYPAYILYHKVRDALYHIGETAMGFVKIRTAGITQAVN